MLRLGNEYAKSGLGKIKVVAALATLASLTVIHPAQAQSSVLMRDDFNARYSRKQTLNPNKWRTYDSGYAYGRTQFGQQPVLASESGASFLRLKLSTYNSNNNAAYPLKGTEMYSPDFTLESGKEFEARVRSNINQGGIVAAFWTYGRRGTWGTSSYAADEIDFEFLTNRTRDSVLFTSWNDWNASLWNYNDGVHHDDAVAVVPGLNWGGWNTYKVRWLGDRIEWFINGVLANTATQVVPNDPMNVRFNIWAPDSSWSQAYDATLQGTTDSKAAAEYYLDVDWVEVRSIT